MLLAAPAIHTKGMRTVLETTFDHYAAVHCEPPGGGKAKR
jgi:hypothetical protein